MSNPTESPFVVNVRVTLRPAVLDTQGKAILNGLHAMGFDSISEIHAGKFFRLLINASDDASALAIARSAAERLLSNPVIETFTVEVATRVAS